MPNEQAVAMVVRAGVGVIVLLMIARHALQPLLSDMFRQRVFRLRRRLFMLRVRGEVSPDAAAYRILMSRMNAVIRRAEGLTFGRLMTVAMVPQPRAMREHYQDPLERALPELDTKTRELIEKAHEDLGYEVVRHVIMTSPLAWGFILVLLPLAPLLKMITFVRQAVLGTMRGLGRRPTVRRFEAGAAELEFDELAPAA